jgi:acyl-CoA synthetase (AMP-forming)/AMP-acid ligase II
MSPAAFLQRPLRWVGAISRYRASRSGGPNFAYDLVVHRTTPEQRAGLDLGGWRNAYNGSEPVRATTMAAFSAAFAEAGFRASAFRPCYGLAEATLVVSSGRWTGDDTAPVSCGVPGCGTRAVIVDPGTLDLCGPNEEGEVWVSGPGVARGYWNSPDLTADTFGARTSSGEGPFLRTGDMGRMVMARWSLRVASKTC